jgi:hypothetical protein
MLLLNIPRDLERAWSRYTLYPESVLMRATTAYRTSVKSLKSRLDENGRLLFVSDESEVEVAFRDFVGEEGRGGAFLDSHLEYDGLTERRT